MIISFVARLVDKISAPSRSMAATIARAEAPVKRVDAAIGSWGKTADRAGGQAKRAERSSLDLGKALRSIDSAARAYSLDPMRRQVMEADKWFNKMPRSLRVATAGLSDFYAGTRRVKDGLKAIPALIEKTDKAMERLSNATIVTDGMARRGQAMMAPFEKANLAGRDFERGMSGIGVTASLTDRQLLPIRGTIMRLSDELNMLPATVQETFGRALGEGVFDGVDNINIASEALVRFMRLAGAGGDELEGKDGGALLAGLKVSLGLRANQIDRAMAMINQSSKDGGITNSVLSRALPSQLGDLKGFGGNNMAGFADLLAANQVAKSKAGQGEAATNNISNLFSALGSSETKKNFSDAGINLEREIRDGLTRGMSPLETIATVVKAKTGGDQFRIAELFSDRQARDGITALVQNLADFKAKRDAIMGANATGGSYNGDLARINADGKSSAESKDAAIARLAISTGRILAPAFTWAANTVERLANWLTKLEESSNPLGKTLVWIAAGAGAFMVAAGSIGSMVVGILGPILIMKATFGGLAPIFGGAGSAILGLGRVLMAFGGTMMTFLFTNPVGWVILLVAAIAGATYVIVKNWDKVKVWFGKFWDWMGTGPVKILGDIARLFVAPGVAIIKGWQPVKAWFGRLWDGIKAPKTDGWLAALTGPIGKAWSATTTWLSKWWSGLSLPKTDGWLAALIGPIGKAWSATITWLSKWWSGLSLPKTDGWLAALIGPIGKAWSATTTWLSKWWSGLSLPKTDGWLAALTGPIGKAWSATTTWLSKWWSGLSLPKTDGWLAALTGPIGKAWSATRTLLSTFWSGLKGPDTAAAGGGLTAMVARVDTATTTWLAGLGPRISAILTAIASGVTALLAGVGQTLGAALGAAASVATLAWQGASHVIGGVFIGVSSAAQAATDLVSAAWSQPPSIIKVNWTPLPPFFAALFARIVASSVQANASLVANMGTAPARSIMASWSPLGGFFTSLWAGIIRTVAGAMARISTMAATPVTMTGFGDFTGGGPGRGGLPPPDFPRAPPPPMQLLAGNRPRDGGGVSSRTNGGRAPITVNNNWQITSPNPAAAGRAVARTPQANGRLFDGSRS